MPFSLRTVPRLFCVNDANDTRASTLEGIVNRNGKNSDSESADLPSMADVSFGISGYYISVAYPFLSYPSTVMIQSDLGFLYHLRTAQESSHRNIL
jgi:hypothetical protein